MKIPSGLGSSMKPKGTRRGDSKTVPWQLGLGMHLFRAAERGDSKSPVCLGARSNCCKCAGKSQNVVTDISIVALPFAKLTKGSVIRVSNPKSVRTDRITQSRLQTNCSLRDVGKQRRESERLLTRSKQRLQIFKQVRRRGGKFHNNDRMSTFKMDPLTHYVFLLNMIRVVHEDDDDGIPTLGGFMAAGNLEATSEFLSIRATRMRRTAKAFNRKLNRQVIREERRLNRGRSLHRSVTGDSAHSVRSSSTATVVRMGLESVMPYSRESSISSLRSVTRNMSSGAMRGTPGPRGPSAIDISLATWYEDGQDEDEDIFDRSGYL